MFHPQKRILIMQSFSKQKARIQCGLCDVFSYSLATRFLRLLKLFLLNGRVGLSRVLADSGILVIDRSSPAEGGSGTFQ